MKIAYFDCFAGISGDMALGALVDLGLPLQILKEELEKLNLSNWELVEEKVLKHGLEGTKVQVKIKEEKKHRHWSEIKQIIEKSTLSPPVKQLSRRIFESLALAEAKVHGVSVEQVHFHEVGALDSIIDIVGFAIGINYWGIEKVYASKLHVGQGTIKCAHGILPVPAPATLELLQGVPIYSSEIEGELVTPTGAALITTVCEKFAYLPEMTVQKIGYGAGEKNLPLANLLRLSIGEVKEKKDYLTEKIVKLESNIDDMNPQIYQYVLEMLLLEGALDAYLQPVQMKKSRPAIILHVLVQEEKLEQVLSIIFAETTTLGIRIMPLERKILFREIKQVKTVYGLIDVKIAKLGEKIVNFMPEYEQCVARAQEKKVPLQEIMEEAKKAAKQQVRVE